MLTTLLIAACDTSDLGVRGTETASDCPDLGIRWEFEGATPNPYMPDTFGKVVYHDGYLHMLGNTFDGQSDSTYHRVSSGDGSMAGSSRITGPSGEHVSLEDIDVNPSGRVYIGGLYHGEGEFIGYAATFLSGSSLRKYAVGANRVASVAGGVNLYAVSPSNNSADVWLQTHLNGTETTGFAITSRSLGTWSLPGYSLDLAVAPDGTTYSTGIDHILAFTPAISPGTFTTRSAATTTEFQLNRLGRMTPQGLDTAATVSGGIRTFDLELATDGSVYVTGVLVEHETSYEYLYIGRFNSVAETVWEWVFSDSDVPGVQVAVDPASGTPYTAWVTRSGELLIASLDPATGNTRGLTGCDPLEGWRYDLAGLDIDPNGSLYLSGTKRYTGSPGSNGRGFLIRADLHRDDH